MSDEDDQVIICPVCLHAGTRGPGPGGRASASCRECGSLERHRSLLGVLDGVAGSLARGCLVDVAPSPLVSGRLSAMAGRAGVPYVGMDFDPGADSRVVNLQASMTDLPLPDDSVGLMVCFHVLEHIPDDAAAMREMARVLAPGGLAVVQVPRRAGVPTDEDPSVVTPAERLSRFGQADHVRYYGEDFEERLQAGGLHVSALTSGDLYDPVLAAMLGIAPQEPLWLCASDAAPEVEHLVPACDAAARATLAGGLAQLARERDRARERVRTVREKLETQRAAREEAEGREHALRSRADVRVTTAVGRRAKRLLRRA